MSLSYVNMSIAVEDSVSLLKSAPSQTNERPVKTESRCTGVFSHTCDVCVCVRVCAYGLFLLSCSGSHHMSKQESEL